MLRVLSFNSVLFPNYYKKIMGLPWFNVFNGLISSYLMFLASSCF